MRTAALFCLLLVVVAHGQTPAGGMLSGQQLGWMSLPTPVPASTTWTVEAWVLLQPGMCPSEIFSGYPNNWYRLFFNLSQGIMCTKDGMVGIIGCSATQLAGLTGWHHLAASADGSITTFYVDGAWAGTAPGVSATAIYRIGLLGVSSVCTGSIDEARLWSVPRTATELQATMHLAVDHYPGLLSAWHFDGGAMDTTGPHHGNLVGSATIQPSTAPITGSGTPSCPGAVCLTCNCPMPLGGTGYVILASPSPGAPVFVLVDTATGSLPLGVWGTTQLAFSPALFALADPTGIWGPGFAAPFTNSVGAWGVGLPMPSDPAFASLTLYVEAYVLDFSSPNGLFRQSNLLAVAFQ